MRVWALVIISLCLVGVFGDKSCLSDNDCGSLLPYAQCRGEAGDCYSSVTGVTIDDANGIVYFFQFCRSDAYYPNITLKSVSANGGRPQQIQTRVVVPAPGNPAIILGVVNNDVYYGVGYRSPGFTLFNLDLSTSEETRGIATTDAGYFLNQATFAQGKSFVCNFVYSKGAAAIQRIDGIVGQPGVALQGLTTLHLFSNYASCGSLKKPANSTYLYYVEHSFANSSNYGIPSSVQRVKADCVVPNNTTYCDYQTLFTLNDYINDFDVYDHTIYYGTASGLYSVAIAGGTPIQIVSGTAVTGVRVYEGDIYYNDGVNIQSIPLGGGSSLQLNRPPQGSCTCLSGFSGSDCQSCDGVVQWTNNKPDCVALENGVPVRCTEDYQCGNEPYTVCTGSCTCARGFTGFPICETCDGAVTWTQYGPVCS